MLYKTPTCKPSRPCACSRRLKPVVCSSASRQQVDGVAVLTSRAYSPPRYVGPIAVSDIPGKGLGLVATTNLSSGELLVSCNPLAVALGPPGKPPSNADVVYRLQGLQEDPWAGPWLRLLLHTRGKATEADTWQEQQAAAAAAVRSSRLLQAQQLLEAGSSTTGRLAGVDGDGDAAEHPWSAGSSSNGNGHTAKVLLNPSHLQQVVAECAYSDVCEDVGAAALKELTPESVTGLWPEFSLFNHSCAPNAVAVVIGQSLLVRAVAPVLTGEELTISYMGVDRLAPVARRRAVLQGRYGFLCQCSRCLLEQSTFPTRYYPGDDIVLGPQPLTPPTTAQTASAPALGQGGVGGPAGGQGVSTDSGSDAAAALEGAGSGPHAQQQQQVQGQGKQQQERFGWVWTAADATLQWCGLPPRFTAVGRPLQPSTQHQLLQQVYQEATTSLAVEVRDVVTSDVRVTQRRLAALRQVCLRAAAVSGAIADLQPWQLQPPAAAAQWLQASIFPLLQLQLQLLEVLMSAGGLPSPEQLQAAASAASGSSRWRAWLQRNEPLLPGLDLSSRAAAVGSWCDVVGRQAEVVAAVARGSELHLELAVRHLELVRQVHGPDAVATRAAESFCSAAHVARYGALPSTTLLALVAARRRQLLAASLARRMSVIAWDDESAASGAPGAGG